MSPRYTHGRCRACEKRFAAKGRRPIVYRWLAGPTRRIYMARCPRCGESLAQTTVSNMRRPIIRDEMPRFERF